jgi:hypothetical protein
MSHDTSQAELTLWRAWLTPSATLSSVPGFLNTKTSWLTQEAWGVPQVKKGPSPDRTDVCDAWVQLSEGDKFSQLQEQGQLCRRQKQVVHCSTRTAGHPHINISNTMQQGTAVFLCVQAVTSVGTAAGSGLFIQQWLCPGCGALFTNVTLLPSSSSANAPLDTCM